ncbi:MAG: thioesterase [Flavobacteriales bacterium]|nr:thioesterase [Flavobacteriales bacterium]|tara:strand:+ start:3854 stop:4267 length:414 start_codon:yes stop_codon:yes gene_type:complete
MSLAKKVVKKMINEDAFSQWLGIKVLEISEGFCKLQIQVRDEMTNGFLIAHGGISYSLADSCLAFASNSYGIQSFSLETSISHTKKVESGDILIATSKEINKTNRTALYYITITNQNKEEIAHLKGTVYRTEKKWFS